jgi:hypothetical protein
MSIRNFNFRNSKTTPERTVPFPVGRTYSCMGTWWLTLALKLAMRDEIHKYRDYAMECIRLSQKMPEHKTALLDIAAAWMKVVERNSKAPGYAGDKEPESR